MSGLSDRWPWEPEFLRISLLVPSVIGIIAAAAMYPSAGINALWFLSAVPAGLLFRLVYGIVGTRVDRLRRWSRNIRENVGGART